jgi:tetratricopeptide (TPR) repeat protein
MKRQPQAQSQVISKVNSAVADLDQTGLLALQQGKFAEALAWFQQAIEQDAQQPALHVNAGIAHCRLGDLAQGIAAYERAMAPTPATSTHTRAPIHHEPTKLLCGDF